jgi:transcriptional regulator GlxA family with amidase domain
MARVAGKPGGSIHVLFALLPHTLALDWAGPAEAFRLANQSLVRAGQPPRFVMRFVGVQSQMLSSVGLLWANIEALPSELPDTTWLVLMGRPDEAAGQGLAEQRELLRWLRGLHGLRGRAGDEAGALPAPHKLITICSGAVLAAQAGLLAHTRATTHHLELGELQRADASCEVLANRVFVEDERRRVYSSAGITTGIDLAVHLIAQECGEAIAARVAHVMVMPQRRGPADAALSPFMQGRSHLHAGVHRVQDALCAAPTKDWSVAQMAGLAHTSARHLSRLFVQYTQQTPLQFLEALRVAVALRLLKNGYSVTRAAIDAGFHNDTQLRRAFKRAGHSGKPSDI